jgi:hypothetical protein
MFPGVAVIPVDDGRRHRWSLPHARRHSDYGVSGMFSDGATTNAHGLNERIRVQSLLEGPRVPAPAHETVRRR